MDETQGPRGREEGGGSMLKRNPDRRREPLTDTMLLVTITIGIFFAMYFSAMAIWGGGLLR